MKILAIRGKNLASLEGEFEIDFTKEPLKSTGLFAITGPTGSGKSTLLDAICLALFDTTPRTNSSAESTIQIIDVNHKTINQKDARTVLRRGSAEGYAQVDFVSLGGESYRSTWRVRRSRNKANGSLQSTDFRVLNLSTQQELSGRKTELLAKVVELIGLTFYQFTRAVLLAQGDFATFLKATQKEKAELLEKLTGTDIYSKLSVSIYEQCKQAEQDLKLLRERIKDVELLSADQKVDLMREQAAHLSALEKLKEEAQLFTKKMEWITANEVLLKEQAQAEEAAKNAANRLEQAQPRIHHLSQIDAVQAIRDPFKTLQQTQQQQRANQLQLVQQEKEEQRIQQQLERVNQACSSAKEKVEQLEQFAEQQKPLLDRARALDLRIATGRQVTQEAQQVYTHAVEDLEKRKSTIRSMLTAQAKLEKEQTTISHWMLQHKPYEPLIPRVELLESYVTNVQYVRQQLQQNKTFLQETEKRLTHRRSELEQLTAEAERLNQLLPAEIVVLRKKLEAGKPCPVCGSLQHCVNTVEMESLQEAELNKQKSAVQKRTDIVKKELEQLEAGKQRLCSSIESDTTHLKDGMDKLSTSLEGLPAWQGFFAAGTLIKMLQDIATQWNRFTVDESAIKEKLTTIHSQLTVHLAAVEKESELVVKQKELWRGKQQQLQQLETECAALFAGKTVQAMEQELKMERNRRATLLTTQTELQNRWKGSLESCKGAKKELLATGVRLKQSILSLQKTVNDWMGQQEIVDSIEELTQLLEKESGWLAAERAALDALREQRTVTQTTLQEKRERYKQQQEQPIQPTEEETASHLALLLKANKEQVEQLSNRNITIKLAFEKDKAGKERIQAFEKELEKRQELAENWKKLNDLFGSADGAKFKVLAQGYTLEVLLSYANKHLHELSKRYELQRIPNSLALQVVDLDMLGEIRTVHSLSGGESFLISLALALGLSSLSSNRMHVESLFIDEGFGSLDVDTLRVAMDALEHLQTQGRKIGVISHVAEMTEHITTQIRVIKTANGRSKIEVI